VQPCASWHLLRSCLRSAPSRLRSCLSSAPSECSLAPPGTFCLCRLAPRCFLGAPSVPRELCGRYADVKACEPKRRREEKGGERRSRAETENVGGEDGRRRFTRNSNALTGCSGPGRQAQTLVREAPPRGHPSSSSCLLLSSLEFSDTQSL